MKICLFDPGFEDNNGSVSSNLGDLIIQEAVKRELNGLFPNSEIVSISTQTSMTAEHLGLINNCEAIFVGGTNLLSSNMNKYRQWKISLRKAIQIRKAVLLGVGWWQYQKNPNLYTKLLLKTTLSGKLIHSVRDNYSRRMMELLGFKNILNTGCPTMWPLANVKTDEIPCDKSDNVLLTLTDYSKNSEADRKLLELLFANYKKVYFWPQGRTDHLYITELNFPVLMLKHSVKSLDDFLSSGIRCDYIGTRLHGGIRCILAKKRSLIVGVDNRAKEIALDTGLNVIERADLDLIRLWINSHVITKLKINTDEINKWKNQFKSKES